MVSENICKLRHKLKNAKNLLGLTWSWQNKPWFIKESSSVWWDLSIFQYSVPPVFTGEVTACWRATVRTRRCLPSGYTEETWYHSTRPSRWPSYPTWGVPGQFLVFANPLFISRLKATLSPPWMSLEWKVSWTWCLPDPISEPQGHASPYRSP